MNAWLVSIYFGGLRVTGAIVARLRGVIGHTPTPPVSNFTPKLRRDTCVMGQKNK